MIKLKKREARILEVDLFYMNQMKTIVLKGKPINPEQKQLISIARNHIESIKAIYEKDGIFYNVDRFLWFAIGMASMSLMDFLMTSINSI